MNLLPKNLRKKLGATPMLIGLGAVALGILLADHFSLPLWSMVVGFVVSVGMALVCYGGRFYRLYILLAMLFAGGISITLARAESRGVFGEQERSVRLKVGEVKVDARGVARAEAKVSEVDGQAHSFRVRLTTTAEVGLQPNEELLAKVRLREFGYEHSRYEEYMWLSGVQGEIFLTPQSIISRSGAELSLPERMRKRASERVARLGLSFEVEAIVRAVATGDRSMISTEQRRCYVRSGSAHILAVSGLHVGYLFMLINILLLPLALLRRGQIARCVVAIFLIWCYALMTGLEPSVERAAIMFTLLQISFMAASKYNSLGALALTAVVMLLVRGDNLYNAGFQLSMLAVFAIVEWVMPVKIYLMKEIFSRLESRSLKNQSVRLNFALMGVLRLVEWSLASIMIAVAAAIVTMPLASYLFGQVSAWSVVVGPLMVLLGGVVVGLSIAWIVLPFSSLEGMVSWALELTTSWMNSLAEWCSEIGVLAVDWRIDFSLCVGIYIVYFLVTVVVWSVREE